MKPDSPSFWRVGSIVMVGVGAISTAAPLVRLAMSAAGERGVGFSLVLAALRLGLAAIVLLPTWRTFHRNTPTWSALWWAIAAGIALSLHFAAWIASLSYTSIAASTALVTTNPVWVALFSWYWLREKLSRQTLAGIGVACAGGLMIGWGGTDSADDGSNSLLGNGLALVGAWAASGYFLLGREAQRNGLSISRYVAVAYTTAAIALFPLPLIVGANYTGYSLSAYGFIVLTALIPQLIGHTSINWTFRWLKPTTVTLLILFEPVLSSVLGVILFGEVPSSFVLVGALVLLAGVAIAVSDKNE